jgi:hypothetical protein
MKNLILLIFFLTVFYAYSQVDSVRFNSCEIQGNGNIQNRIISIKRVNDSIYYKIGIIGNCILDTTYFLHLHWLDDDALDFRIKYRNVKELCECYYELDFSLFRSTNKQNPKLKFDNVEIVQSPHLFKIVPVKFQLFEGDTINYFDQFGIKIGKHFSFDEFNNPESVIYFGNGLRIWEADFDRKNKMKNITFFRDEKSLENISEKRLNRLMRKYERTFNRK